MSANALRHVIRRREHRERAQPQARQARFGLLEKHKDYKLRAVDYHRKQDALRVMKEKAAFRNEDEFYMKMNKSKTKHGVHILERDNSLTPAAVKRMKAQDLAYLQSQKNNDARKIEKLKQSMHFLMEEDEEEEEEEEEDGEDEGDQDDDDEEDDSAGRPAKRAKTSNKEAAIKSKHVIFVDDSKELKAFSPAQYFQTVPELVNRKFNRLRSEQLKSGEVLVNQTHEVKKLHRAASAAQKAGSFVPALAPASSAAAAAATSKAVGVIHGLQAKADQSLLAGYTEIAARLDRKRKVQEAVDKLQLEKHLSGKGARKRIVPKEENRFGEADEKKVVYKWKLERKK